MPRQSRAKGQNNFVAGLVTETTALKFPENACTETFNCVFDETGRVSRRLGFDLEEGHEFNTVTLADDDAFTEYLWQAVGGDGNSTIFVQQQGATLRFFNLSTVSTLTSLYASTIDLNDFLADTSTREPGAFACQYAAGNGDLIVVNQACDPFFVRFDSNTQLFVGTTIEVQHRDFLGLDDGLTLTERPTATVTTLKSTNPEHYYNLLNQGWHQGGDDGTNAALHQWDTARSDLPSNADQMALYRGSATDSFDNARVLAQTPGNTPAPKGHFIITAWNPDREAAAVAEGFTGLDLDPTVSLIPSSTGTIIHDATLWTDTAAAFDDDSDQAATDCADRNAINGYIGKTFPSMVAIAKAEVWGSNDLGYITETDTNSVTIHVRAKVGAAPTSRTNGDSLGSVTFADGATADKQTITSIDSSTLWDHVWLDISSVDDHLNIAEIRFFSPVAVPGTVYSIERPTCTEFFAGRVWYAGINTSGASSKLFFSQIIESSEQYGKCYQVNDPSSEDFTDLLPSDGGFVSIPEIGTVKRMFAYQNSLLVYASNGVWQVSGSSNGSFLATDYTVRKLSSIGTQSPLSFASFRGVPAWWAEDGIYTVQFDPNYGTFTVTSITDAKIKSFIADIPEFNRQFVKGCYDVRDQVIYYLYNSTEELDAADIYKYNSVLVLNGLSGAFYPWTIEGTDALVRGIFYAVPANQVDNSRIKYTTTVGSNLAYSEARQTTYKDWSLVSDILNNGTVEADYTSYFITGFNIVGDAQRFGQMNYIWVYLDNVPMSSCFMQGIFDFTNNGNSGKWSSRQQVFNPCLGNRSINHRRLKVRGKGKAAQLKFVSESGKPFNIIGWSSWETINANI